VREIRHIVVHCSATPNGNANFTIADLDRMHRERGWKKIGYHYVIEIDGLLSHGRPIEEIGAHVAGSNATSIGICMIGTDKFTARQWDALKALVEYLQRRFPTAKVCGHRDFSPDLNGDGIIQKHEWIKICPGFDVKSWLQNTMKPFPVHVVA
jgi:N-acetyl-anhydromuramyl-L-alanine amidase AmpD